MEAIFITFFILGIGLFHLGIGNAQNYFEVVKFGAIGDGRNDDTTAFLKAWETLCRSGTNGDHATLEVAANKTFLLSPLELAGPCNFNSIHIQVLGKIMAPDAATAAAAKLSNKCWLCFKDVNGLVLDGSGQIDGNGGTWWGKYSSRPTALYFDTCNDLKLSGLTHLNSPKSHITVHNSNGVSISDLHITAPADSPNTDGIDISSSTQVFISHSFIGTGDDCVAIKGGSSNVNVTDVTCGPGHGISVGDLGEDGGDQTVEQVYVTGCTFKGSANGARIKTSPGGTGFAKDVFFQEITLIASGNPIVIDQHYCHGSEHHCGDEGKAVDVSGVTFRGFHGTSADVEAINLDCSNQGCREITLGNINITSSVGKQLQVICKNAHGTATSSVPAVSCLLS